MSFRITQLKKWTIGEFSVHRLLRSVVEIYVCLLVVAYFISDKDTNPNCAL